MEWLLVVKRLKLQCNDARIARVNIWSDALGVVELK